MRMSLAVADRVTALAERPDHQGVVALCDPYPYADAAELLARPGRARRRARRRHRSAQPRRHRALVRVPRRARARDPAARLRRRHRGRREGLGRRGRAPADRAWSRTSPSCCAAASAPTSGAMPPPRTADATPDALDLTGGVVLVLGSEGSGIRPLVRQRCDARSRIPMHGAIGSLNVAVAASLLLYEAERQRRTHARDASHLSANPRGEHAVRARVKCASAHLRSRSVRAMFWPHQCLR